MLATSPRFRWPTGRHPPRLRNLLRYASVSAVSTAVGLSTLALLIGVGHRSPTWSNVVATALGTIPSFELNRRWVWRRQGRSSLLREVAPFCALCLVELVASTLAVHATATFTAHAGWSHTVRTVADLVANVAAYGTLWVVQYLVLDKVLFAHGDGRGDVVDAPVTAGGRQDDQRTLCASSSNVQEPASGWPR